MSVDVKSRAEALANAHTAQAIEAARRTVDAVPEYKVEDDATGKRLLVPAGAMARGMLAFVEETFARAQQQRGAA